MLGFGLSEVLDVSMEDSRLLKRLPREILQTLLRPS